MTHLTLARHGETEWSRDGRHTSVTDLDLTPCGVEQARAVGRRLDPADFGLALCSPRLRARRTAELAGFGDVEIDPDLAEWDYGRYEGVTTPEIRESVPDWTVFTHGAPDGESVEAARARLERVVARVRASGVEQAICFGHGHALRLLMLAWTGLPTAAGNSFPLHTGTLSVLGQEKEFGAVLSWNA